MTKEEEMALRELAAKPHYISKVSDVLGPLSLWSKSGLEAEIRKAVEAEREACAKAIEKSRVVEMVVYPKDYLISRNDVQKCYDHQHKHCVEAIRARGDK